MSMSDVRGAQVAAGFGHGRSLSQERSLQPQDRNRAKSRTRVHGLADIDPKFISQVRGEMGQGESRPFFCYFLFWAAGQHYSGLMIFLTFLLTKQEKDCLQSPVSSLQLIEMGVCLAISLRRILHFDV